MLPYIFIVLALGLRFAFKPVAFTSVSAARRYFGARASRGNAWIAWALCAAADVVLTRIVYSYPLTWDQLFTWAWYAVALGLGMSLRSTNNPLRIGATSLLSSIIFFVVSNFSVWASYRTLYAATLRGLINCYVAAVPFFRHTLAADLVFTAIFFGLPLVLQGAGGDILSPAGARKRYTAR
jgi:hypothetical protein